MREYSYTPPCIGENLWCKKIDQFNIPDTKIEIKNNKVGKKINNKSEVGKRKTIPLTVKRVIWDKYIGETVGMTKCFICKSNQIRQLSFHAGHIISHANGGSDEADNLRPICQTCNSSMGSQNMDEFIRAYGL